ncbi:MAG: RHS repeat-associated core domain-containing protein [Lachnospiraceae bacterium]|nr:RHS repeat-associated core domain-containing protein [Lachnospiraceae bacterium]
MANNHLLYRGYYYDSETGLYYLNSRYYDPEVGRFINSDDARYLGANGNLNSYNLFAYCLNNPVALSDNSGKFAITTAILIGSAIIGAATALYTGYKMRQAGENWGDTIFSSAETGLCAFFTVYTLGMSAYELYYNMSSYYGHEPVTEIGKKPQPTIPQEAYDTYDFVTTHNGTPPKGYKGGKTF